jgi:hypothetical protein
MRRLLTAAFAVLSLTLVAGCGGEEAASTLPAAGASGSVPTDPIAKVVYDFLDTVRQGRTAEANQWLTPLALQRITALNMTIAPPGSPASSFQVKGVTSRQADRALVAITWSDVDDAGKPVHENVFFELREVETGWRICGMGQDLGGGRAPMVMNFEAPPTASTPANVATTQAPGAVAPGAIPPGAVAPGAVAPATAMQPGPGALPAAPATIGAAPYMPPAGALAPPAAANPQVAQDPNQPRYQ